MLQPLGAGERTGIPRPNGDFPTQFILGCVDIYRNQMRVAAKSLTVREPDGERVAQTIYYDVNLGAESATAPSERLGLLSAVFLAAPAAHGCARTTVLSGITLSMSASSLK